MQNVVRRHHETHRRFKKRSGHLVLRLPEKRLKLMVLTENTGVTLGVILALL